MKKEAESLPANRGLREFRREVQISMRDICREIFRERDHGIQVQNEKIAIRNLMRIIDATLAIANRKGFAAMSLRDLARRTGLSMGGLYAYIGSKDDLVALIQSHGQRQTERILARRLQNVSAPWERLRVGIRTHLYLSEVLRPWFYFAYMEARHLAATQRRRAIAMERETEALFARIIEEGQAAGAFRAVDELVAAGMLKALLQDWYLKHGKHRERSLDVERYADHVEEIMRCYLLR